MELSKDILILPAGSGRWIIFNAFAKTAVGASFELLNLLSSSESLSDQSCDVWDIERFTNIDGLMADPSRFVRDPAAWGAPRRLAGDELVQFLQRHCILIADHPAYLARFQGKKSLLDTQHFGNFHQQVGQQLFFHRKGDPVAWWVLQKFASADAREVRRDNLYGAVQASFLARYFQRELRPGMQVLDVGCGVGLYANQMAGHGASVLAVDPSDEYLTTAKNHGSKGVTFMKANPGHPGGMAMVPDASADLIWMSDALLFYFFPINEGDTADLQVLLGDIVRILKPGGKFVSLEPHSVFWTAPWLGEEARPFTVLHEYMHRKFGVVPPVSHVIQEFARAGLCVTWMEELVPEADYQGPIEPRALEFAREFPVWQLFEAQVIPRQGAK